MSVVIGLSHFNSFLGGENGILAPPKGVNMLSRKVKEAIRDLRYLLDRGYPRDSAVEFVTNHYRLRLGQRHLLARCVFSHSEIIRHRGKSISMSEVRGQKLGIDGYNVLITVESILTKKQVIRCDDGFIRDLRAIFGKYRMTRSTRRALAELLQVVSDVRPRETVILFDQQVSRSGELAAMAREVLAQLGLRGDARTAVGTDAKVRGFDVAASSDRAIIERARAVWDIPAAVVRRRSAKVVDLSKIR